MIVGGKKIHLGLIAIYALVVSPLILSAYALGGIDIRVGLATALAYIALSVVVFRHIFVEDVYDIEHTLVKDVNRRLKTARDLVAEKKFEEAEKELLEALCLVSRHVNSEKYPLVCHEIYVAKIDSVEKARDQPHPSSHME